MPDLGHAHKGYAFQDLVSAFIFADGLVNEYTTRVDSKIHSLDVFDDLTTENSRRSIRRQIKTGDSSRTLQIEDLKTQQADTRLDDLIRSVKGDPVVASEYRLCVTWKIDSADPIMKFLEPVQAETTFGPHKSTVFRLRADLIWPASQPPIWQCLKSATDIFREDLLYFSSLFSLEAECPFGSLNLDQPGPLELLVFQKLSQEVGIGRYPNNELGPVEAAALLITLATRARVEHQPISARDCVSLLALRTDYGRVAQRFPINKNFLVKTESLLAELTRLANRSSKLVVTGEPGSGKSWALSQLSNDLAAAGAIVTRHYCYLEPGDPDVQKRILTNTLFGNLISELASHNPKLSEIVRPRFSAGPDELEDLLRKLHEASPDTHIYLIVDGLDHISRVFADSIHLSAAETDIAERVALLSLPDNVTLIVGSQPGNHLRALLEVADSFSMPAWTSEEILNLAKRIGVYESLTDAGFEHLTVQFESELAARAEGNPLYTTFVCKQIKRVIAEGADPVSAIREIPTHEGDLGNYYRYLLSGDADRLTSDIADILGVVDFSVTESDLAEILPNASHRIQKVLIRLLPVLEQAAMQGGVRIYHESFRRFTARNLEHSGASLSSVLAPVIQWFHNKDFYKDAKAYRFLMPSLRRAEKLGELYELCDSSFVSKSIEAGHAPDAITQNLLIVVDSAYRSANWQILGRVSELQRSLATFVADGLEPGRYGRAFAAVRGSAALNERLLFEGRPTYSRDVGLILCSLCDDDGQTPPWRDYLGLDRDTDQNRDQNLVVDQAAFHGFIRIRGAEEAQNALADFLLKKPDQPNSVQYYIRRLGRSAGLAYLEALAETKGLSTDVSAKIELELARQASEGGQSEKAKAIATALINRAIDIVTAFECANLGASVSNYDTDRIDLNAFDIGIGSKTYFEDEVSVRGWVSALGMLALAGDSRLEQVGESLAGDGWYRCWLRYVLALSKAEALSVSKVEGVEEETLSAFRHLTVDLHPFSGSPRACDLYRIHSLIHETLERGLRLVKSRQAWASVLFILGEVSEHTTTRFQNDPSGPLDVEALFQILKPYTMREDVGGKVLLAIEEIFNRRQKSGGLYYNYANQELLLAEISISSGDADLAESHWRSASRYMCAYGQRKDITIYELLDSVECLSQANEETAIRAIGELQPLVDAVIDHTDGKSISSSPVSWFDHCHRIEPEGAVFLLCRTLLRRAGTYDWRVESAVASTIKRNFELADPLILSLLCLASPPGEDRISYADSFGAIERTLRVYPDFGRTVLELFLPIATGDNAAYDPELLARIQRAFAELGISYPEFSDPLPRKKVEQKLPLNGNLRRNGDHHRFEMPQRRSLLGACPRFSIL